MPTCLCHTYQRRFITLVVVVESDKLPTDVYIDLFDGLYGSSDKSQSSVHSRTNVDICLIYT